ncbi:MAG: hypothetical protein JSV68_25095 [Anaerolineaceae bacterium]|nr:MAG: hypothetical protein JSV68_25095 [Anaerolineaceae bacterium]
MKRLVYVSTLFGIVALMVLLVAGSAGAYPLAQAGPGEGEIEPEPEGGLPGEGEAEPEPEAAEAEPAEAGPSGTAVRIDFEVAGHKAKRGLYVVTEIGGAEYASWYALDGWEDSGWIEFDLPLGAVYVDVLYYPGPDTEPTVMRILNPAFDSTHGWVARAVAHALEVAWPDQEIVAEADQNP